jgi:hypothetical protein
MKQLNFFRINIAWTEKANTWSNHVYFTRVTKPLSLLLSPWRRQGAVCAYQIFPAQSADPARCLRNSDSQARRIVRIKYAKKLSKIKKKVCLTFFKKKKYLRSVGVT